MDNHTSKTSEYKTCTKCGETKLRSEYHKTSSHKDGLAYWCKDCAVLHARNYRKNNPESFKNTQRKYRLKNSSKRAKYNKEWRKNNPDYGYIWQKENREKRIDSYNRRRARIENNGTFIVTEKFLRKLRSSSCVGCGSRHDITADHVIPIARGGTHSEGNLQPLCRSCNTSKGGKLMIEWRLWRRNNVWFRAWC